MGNPGDESNPGFNLALAPNVRLAVHLTAMDEVRYGFGLSSIIDPDNPDDSRTLEIALPGVHAEVGGGYGGALELEALETMVALAESMGGLDFGGYRNDEGMFDFISQEDPLLNDPVKYPIDLLVRDRLGTLGRGFFTQSNPKYEAGGTGEMLLSPRLGGLLNSTYRQRFKLWQSYMRRFGPATMVPKE